MATVEVHFEQTAPHIMQDCVYAKFPTGPRFLIGYMAYHKGAAFCAINAWLDLEPEDQELLTEIIRDAKGYKCRIATPPKLPRALPGLSSTAGRGDMPRSKPIWVPSEFVR